MLWQPERSQVPWPSAQPTTCMCSVSTITTSKPQRVDSLPTWSPNCVRMICAVLTISWSKVEDYIAPLKAVGLEVTTFLRVGDPRSVIVQTADELKADALVIGSHSKR